ncbi:hypothetical protein, partial [Clostridium sp.]|uniref:hypothetical protein n=1 Tax=Clostridium sp. TaxID=1506 RepID=UPI003463C957
IYDIIKDNLFYVKNDEKGDLYYLFNEAKVEVKVEDKILDLTKHKDKVSEVLTGVIREDKDSAYDYKDKSYTLWYQFEDNSKAEVKVYDNYVEYEGKKYNITNVLYTFEKLLKDIGGI